MFYKLQLYRGTAFVAIVGVLAILAAIPASATDDYPVLPYYWEYLGYVYDTDSTGVPEQTNFHLDRLEVYPECPGLEIINTGHHSGTHVAVQYQQDGEWRWRPALYPDKQSIPSLDLFSGCMLAADPDNPGAYFLTYQRSGPLGTHALFYIAPRNVTSPDQQPYDGHALLTGRDEVGEPPGDTICKGGVWDLPTTFTRGGKTCLLTIPFGDLGVRDSEPCNSSYAVVLSLEAGETWSTIPRNRYQHIWIDDGQDWVPLRWNALDILGTEPSSYTDPGTRARAALFSYGGSLYMLAAGGASKHTLVWSNPTSRGFVTLYRFLDDPPPGPQMDYRVERIQAIVDPIDALPNTPAMVGGFLPGQVSPFRLSETPQPVPSFLIGLTRREIDDPERWIYDYDSGPRAVPGGFVVVAGYEGAKGPQFRLQPPYPGKYDFEGSYPAVPWPGADGDDVIFKTTWDSTNVTIFAPKLEGAFDLNHERILFDESLVVPSADWRMDEFQSAFIGVFDNPLAGLDLVVPISFKSLNNPNCYRHTYMVWRDLMTGVEDSDGGAARISLLPAYPNPFTHDSVVRFSQPEPGAATLSIYDLAGRLVRTITREFSAPGRQDFTWDGRGDDGGPAPAGVYHFKLETGSGVSSGKMVRIR